MQRTYGVPHYSRRPRKAVSVYEEYGHKDPVKKVTFEAVKTKKKRKKKG